ncbi:MAG: ABC transporter ATP-binding protein [Pseudomonadota bacterium]
MTALTCRNVGVRIGNNQILEDVSFDIEHGALIGVIGPNGAGKSTLMRAMAGIIAYDGKVIWDGARVEDMTANERAQTFAYMPQERTVHWSLRCLDVVLLGRLPFSPRMFGVSVNDVEHARAAMARMNVLAFENRSFDTLSGGEKARVLIARMLAQDPRVFIADEPINGLDPAHQISLMEDFQALARSGRLVFVSLHDLTLAGRWCDRLLLLDKGRLRSNGTRALLLESRVIGEVYRIETVPITLDGTLTVVPASRTERLNDRHEIREISK